MFQLKYISFFCICTVFIACSVSFIVCVVLCAVLFKSGVVLVMYVVCVVFYRSTTTTTTTTITG
jgi:hypothetical protein